MFSQMRRGNGETSELEEKPGVLFDTQDFYEMHAFFSVALLLNCTEAFLMVEGEDYFLFVSDDEFVSVICRNQAVYDEMFELVKRWNPKDHKDLWDE
jgi:hypothetical protein